MRADGAGRSSRPQGEVSVLQAIDALNNEFAEEDFPAESRGRAGPLRLSSRLAPVWLWPPAMVPSRGLCLLTMLIEIVISRGERRSPAVGEQTIYLPAHPTALSSRSAPVHLQGARPTNSDERHSMDNTGVHAAPPAHSRRSSSYTTTDHALASHMPQSCRRPLWSASTRCSTSPTR